VRERAVESGSAVEAAEAAAVASAPTPAGGTTPPHTGGSAVAPARSNRAKAANNPAANPGALRTSGPDGLPWVATDDELAALDGLGKEGVWPAGGQELKLTNHDKVLFPPPDGSDDPPITKRELIRYFARISPAILPHLAERPLNLQRFPNGANGPSFWQKDLPESTPGWLRKWRETGVEEREDRKPNLHLVADRVAAMCWLGNQAAFEIHAWTARIDDPWRPTFALVDVDPGDRTTWDETLMLARLYRTAFEHLGVRAYPKLTGKRGIQAWIPVVPGRYTYADTSAWVEKVSKAVGAMVPDLVSWEWSKADRRGRARLDYTQNASIKTLVAPYAVRPSAGAPVSAPIAWEELDDPELRPNRWTIRNVVERVAEVGDLFGPAQTDAQELPKV
jgi:bifunctional non-homologous end joining protein LigD